MIHIIDIAQKVNSFLSDKGFEKYKIFIRINFSLDVYVFTLPKNDRQLLSNGIKAENKEELYRILEEYY